MTEIVSSRASKKAEAPIRDAVSSALAGCFQETPTAERAFDALWRHAIADGLWTRTGGHPRTLALEVKVGEDVGAPFCQALDDLGAFDAVVYVRLISEQTHAEMGRLSGLHALKAEVQKRLPVRFIDVHF